MVLTFESLRDFRATITPTDSDTEPFDIYSINSREAAKITEEKTLLIFLHPNADGSKVNSPVSFITTDIVIDDEFAVGATRWILKQIEENQRLCAYSLQVKSGADGLLYVVNIPDQTEGYLDLSTPGRLEMISKHRFN